MGGAAATDFRPIPTIFYVDLRISAIAVGGETLAKQRQGSTGTQLFLLRPTFERSMSRDFGAERLIKAPVSYRHERCPNWWVFANREPQRSRPPLTGSIMVWRLSEDA